MSLTDGEKAALAKKVGSTASIMFASVARLYLASPNPKAKKNDPDSVLRSFPDLSDTQWKYTNVMGALVLVMDRTLQTFLFRIYDIEAPHEMRFEFELYEDIEYKALNTTFHSFEMEDCVGGFSFCNNEDSPRFLSKVNALKPSAKDNAIDALKGHSKGGGLFSSFRTKEKKPTVPQVSSVVNVVHTQHIGINPDGTFDLNNISPEWKQLFRQAGIKKKDLANPEVAKAIISTIAASTGATVQITPQKLPTEDEIKKYYTPDQQRELEEYQKAMAKYEADLAAYEAEQAALAAWERDNAKYLEEQAAKEKAETERVAKEKAEEAKRAGLPPQSSSKKGPPPVAPPRNKVKEEAKLAPAPQRRKSSILKLFGVGAAEEAAPSSDIGVVPAGKTALQVGEEEAERTRQQAVQSKERAEQEAESVRRAAEQARIAAEEEAESMRQAAVRARAKAEEEAAAWLQLAAQAKTKAEQDALLEQKMAEATRLRAQEEALKVKEEAAIARRKAQEEAEAELKEAAEARKRAQADAERERHEAQTAREKAKKEAAQAQEEAAAEREYTRKLAEIAKREQEELLARAKQEAEAQRLEAEQTRIRAKEEAEAASKAAAAEREYALKLAEIAKREHEEMLGRERENQRRLAEIAAKEQEEMMEQLRLMQERTRAAKALLEEEERKAEELQRLALKKRAPPIPARLPDKPPLPAQPPAPPKPPMPPSLPPIPSTPQTVTRSPSVLIGLQLGEVKLKKAEGVNDKSAPDVTGQRGRAANQKNNALLGGIEQGVKLKQASQQQSALPQIKEMDKKVQANIMTSLIETMNVRRGALHGDDEEEDDGWSD